MATAQFPSSTPFKHEADVDMNSFIDFTAGDSFPSPKHDSFLPRPALEASELPDSEDFQSYSGPSHEYERYQQQTGLPPAALTHLHAFIDEETQTLSQPTSASGNFDIPTAAFNEDNSFDSILDDTMDGFPFDEQNASATQSQINHDVVRRSKQRRSLQENYVSGPTQRLAVPNQVPFGNAQRSQSVSTPQQTLHPQQTLQASPIVSRPTSQQHFDPNINVEDTIHRLIQKIRQDSVQSGPSADDAGSPGSTTPHLARAKKDEEEMDEDERLLASEEGKKLSSKERRQLRNKVSARAFRHRRKEYINTLEDELKKKAGDLEDALAQNHRLKKENEQMTAFIKEMLAKPAFRGTLEDMASESQFQPQNSSMAPPRRRTASAQMMAPVTTTNMQNFGMATSPMAYQAPQQAFSQQSQPTMQGPRSSGQDFDMSAISSLNLQTGNDQWGNTNSQNSATSNQWSGDASMTFDFNNLQSFAVLELPEGPSLEELRSETLSGKGSVSISSIFDISQEPKSDFPNIREFMPRLAERTDSPTGCSALKESKPSESDLDLFCDPPADTLSKRPLVRAEKYELVILSSSDTFKTLEERLESMCRVLETSIQHLERLI